METKDYSEIGGLLIRARREHGLSLDQAGQALHIRPRYLEALEVGKLELLPGSAYVKGYLQTYAVFLGLDKEEILRRFEQVEGAMAARGFFLPQVFSKEKKPGPWMVRGGITAAVVIYLFWLVALRPATVPISVVERFPQPGDEKMHLSAAVLDDVACLRPQERLYPPCTMARIINPVGRKAAAQDFVRDPALRLRRPQD